MGENSKIEWCHHTYNHWIGCTKVSPGCANCYAEAENHRRKWATEGWGPGKPRKLTSERNHSQPFAWDRKAKISGKRHRVFCSSLADWLDDEVPVQWLVRLLATIRRCRHLDWLMLTKRPQNFLGRMEALLREPQNDLPDGLSDWIEKWLSGKPPQHVWMGTSTEDQARADERIPILLSIPAKIHWLSVEPLLGPIELNAFLNPQPYICPKPNGARIDWVVVGGESGPNARGCDPRWVREIRDQCLNFQTSFFFKQWGEWMPPQQAFPANDQGLQFEFSGEHYHKLGKKITGRLLDGVEYSQFPEVAL
jgi:protein gp37